MPVISNTKVTMLPNGIEIAAGNISGIKNSGYSGQNTAVGTSYEAVTRLGGTRNELYSNPCNESTGQTIKVKSSSTSDVNNGGGNARRVKIKGLGPDGVEQDENINLNGTNLVESTLNFTAVEKVIVNKVGSGGNTNAGDITVYANDGTTALIQSAAGEGTGGGAFGYCPAGKNLYLTQFFVSSIEEAEVGVFSRKFGTAFGVRQTMFLKDGSGNYVSEAPIQLTPGDSFEIRAKRLRSTDAKVSVDVQVFLEDQ